ncbi:MAG: zinc-ribbon domain-containing protein [Candidatus Viridilinea halotolerans]|uniref:non-specific serine/threonine protein kinase n=1 Tax=Candidatus Viridilinea halotolerans TaxID=2491704 RepID=A0A426UBJ2_9CHLR|nr:MAG: zinc-ribbon domain-containing protein [Candidatus Viridilinea halotolerans]
MANAEATSILCPQCHKQNVPHARFCQYCGHDMILNNDAPSDERRYVITRVVKQGGQGAVYEGRDQAGRVYAIKEMLDRFNEARERAEALARFHAEAQLLQGFNHPSIPRVYSYFRDEGRHYLTMDFIYGDDLQELVERHGRLPEAQVLTWADQICAVLTYLHGKGLIYRDMKPSNVMIERSGGAIKLVDFGITTLFRGNERDSQVGTPGYAPPEQYQGLVTPQSDIYALGATLHHLLTGRDPTEQLPFSFPSAQQLEPSLSRRTNDALERALQKVPQNRFATMEDLRVALNAQRQPQPHPAQVRVAPVPAAAAAQVAVPPLPQAQTSPPPPQKRPVARRGPMAAIRSCLAHLVRLVLTLLAIATIATGGYIYAARPAWAEPFAGPVIELIQRAMEEN